MKTCVVLVSFLSVLLTGSGKSIPDQDDGTQMEYFLVESQPGLYTVEDLVNAEVDLKASSSDLAYYFYSKNNPNTGTEIKSANIVPLQSTEFSTSKDTIFVVHGWKNDNESSVNYDIRGAILAKYDINVFVVDWSKIAGKNYVSAQGSVTAVGNYVAELIRSLVATYGLSLDRVAFVGHSLGAHIAGNAGAALNGQVDHIVGLDPALPLFSSGNTNNRLDPTDAKFVQVIHTNGGLLGFKNSIGHSDFFPNGGSSQPGCGLDVTGSCAHSRAYLYYSEAISSSSNLFVARQCSSYSDYSNARCNSNTGSVMGGYSIDKLLGDFYLDTNSGSPYAKG